jgi:hypothetical protein
MSTPTTQEDTAMMTAIGIFFVLTLAVLGALAAAR